MLSLLVGEVHYHSNKVAHVQVIINSCLELNVIEATNTSQTVSQLSLERYLVLANCRKQILHAVVCIVEHQLVHRRSVALLKRR